MLLITLVLTLLRGREESRAEEEPQVREESRAEEEPQVREESRAEEEGRV